MESSKNELEQIINAVKDFETKYPDLLLLVGNIYFACNRFVNQFTIKKDDEITSNPLLEAFFRLIKNEEKENV